MSLCKRCVWLSEGGRPKEGDGAVRPRTMNESPGLCFISELLAGSFIFIILRAIIAKTKQTTALRCNARSQNKTRAETSARYKPVSFTPVIYLWVFFQLVKRQEFPSCACRRARVCLSQWGDLEVLLFCAAACSRHKVNSPPCRWEEKGVSNNNTLDRSSRAGC